MTEKEKGLGEGAAPENLKQELKKETPKEEEKSAPATSSEGSGKKKKKINRMNLQEIEKNLMALEAKDKSLSSLYAQHLLERKHELTNRPSSI